MEQPDWGARLVKAIAGEVRRHRDSQGISAQVLADRCAQLGWPIKRSVISNLESGYRETITVPEIFILAMALQVPPLLLLLPLGYAESVELAPGVAVPTQAAQQWLHGEEPLPGASWTKDATATVWGFQVHRNTVGLLLNHLDRARRARARGASGEADQLDRETDQLAGQLRNHRRLMREQKLEPPPLPSELEYVDAVREP